jgi:spermidine synthase
MGFSFSATQVVMARELLISFTGNELSIGLVLGNWLILEAVGSGVLGKLGGRMRAGPVGYAGLQVALALVLPLSLSAAATVQRIIGTTAGEGVGLMPMVWSSLLVLAPLGLVDGAMFTFGCRAYARLMDDRRQSASAVYVLEAVGGIVGGLAFTYLFIPYLEPVQMVLILAVLNLGSAASLFLLAAHSGGGGRAWAGLGVVAPLLLVGLALLFPVNAERAHRWLICQQWRPYQVVGSRNSMYGNVAVVQAGAQYTFFANGVPALTAPMPDAVLMEEMVHLPLLFREVPRQALVVGGGLGGLLSELLKYPLERVDYAEPDPALIQMVREYPTALTEGELADPRVRVHTVDGRLLMRRIARDAPGEYDLLVTNLPYPSTLQLNRLYTEEFFSTARSALAEDGLLVVTLPGADAYMSAGIRCLNRSVYDALSAAFPHVHVIPGEVNVWLASPGLDVTGMPVSDLERRWGERNISSRLMSADHIRYKLRADRLEWFWGSLLASGPVKPNRDLHPSGLLYSLSYWSELFSPGLSGYLNVLSGLRFLHAVGPVIVVCFAAAVIRALGSAGVTVPFAIGSTGFAGMAVDLIVVFAFQILYGYVYRQMALLITSFMVGLSLGGWWMSRWLAAGVERGDLPSALVRVEAAVVLYLAALSLALALMHARGSGPAASAGVRVALLVLNAGAGGLVGLEFPLANALYVPRGVAVGETAGALYAADLVGACLGAVVISVALVPALGIVETCLFLVVLKAGSLGLVVSMGRTLPVTRGRL